MQAMQDKIKVVIVDDEPQSIHRLQDDLATLEDFEVIATSSSAVSAKNLVMSIQPDVLFIDVEMPGQTGFEVLQSLRDEIPMELIVVFYSAFDKYMIDALRASAFDFLLKPYQQDEFELVVDRIRQKMKDGDDMDEDASSVPESSSCSSESVLASQKDQDFSAQVRKSVDSPPGMLTEDHHHTVHEERQVCYSSHLRPKSLHL